MLYTTFDNLALQSNWLCVLDGFHTESIGEKLTKDFCTLCFLLKAKLTNTDISFKIASMQRVHRSSYKSATACVVVFKSTLSLSIELVSSLPESH